MIKVIFCIPGRVFSDNFLNSWSSLLSSCNEFGVKPYLRMAHSNNIYMVRNLCLMGEKNGSPKQKPFQGKMNYDYIMWIDSDNVFTAGQFKDLLDMADKNKQINILAGLYLAEDKKRYLTHYLPNDKRFKIFNSEFVEPAHINTLPKIPFAVWFTGMGFMLVRYGVFESLYYPWFEPKVIKQGSRSVEILGDDASFCLKASERGYKTYVYTNIILGHEKPVVLI